MEVEKSYIEIKVTFIHIVVLLVGVIIIGIFLFYLGFQAGKSSARNQILQGQLPDAAGETDEIQLVDQEDKIAKKGKEPSISDEIKLHQLPPSSDEKKERIKPKPLKKERYFSVQVGAFADYNNAKNYAAKFAKMGYPTEISTIVRNNRNLHRVRVGNFETRTEAKEEQRKLEKMEGKKFAIVRPE
ncbi:MAG: SPOR domain-containing protein [Candidatus Aminicenantes bacterium]|jgi:cell division septation protein DedD